MKRATGTGTAEPRTATAVDEMAALAGGLLPASLLPQGSPGWREWRKLGAGGRDVSSLVFHAAALGVEADDRIAEYLGDPPPWTKTPRQLWREKTRQAASAAPGGNPHIGRGRRLADPARILFNERYGVQCEPCCFVDAERPHRRVSLDGLDKERGVLIKILAPLRLPQEPPPYVVANVAYQWKVLRKGVRVRRAGVVLVAENGNGAQITPLSLPRVPGLGDLALACADAFWEYVAQRREPGPAGNDAVLRMDAEWRQTAEAYLAALDEYEAAKEKKEELRKRLEVLAERLGAYPQVGGKVRVERQSRRGAVDYRRALEEITGMSRAELEARLEEYRKASSETLVIQDLRKHGHPS